MRASDVQAPRVKDEGDEDYLDEIDDLDEDFDDFDFDLDNFLEFGYNKENEE